MITGTQKEKLTDEETRKLGRITGINSYNIFSPDHEFEWERVKRMRREFNDLCEGGRNNNKYFKRIKK